MDPTTTFCPNLACPARGQIGQGNIGVHSRKDRRFLCTECHKTFSATQGPAFYRRRTAADGHLVVTLIAHGCPLQAIVVAFGFDERTVTRWMARGGVQGQAVRPIWSSSRVTSAGASDEIRVKKHSASSGWPWRMLVCPRLWLAGEVREHRDMALMRGLMARVRRCALPRPLLCCTDGLCSYVRAMRETFRDPSHAGAQGRPRWRPWRHLCIAQVVKRYAQRRVVDVERRIIAGTPVRVETLRRRSPGDGVINTASSERLHATLRERLASLRRRGRALARRTPTLQYGMYLIGTVYNFCTPHASLRLVAPGAGRRYVQRTPAMAAGITDHCWSVHELLAYHVPPPRWTPPKQRGWPSYALKRLIERWCGNHG